MRELMTLLIHEIAFDDVVAFCSHQTGENMRLEYKKKFSGKDAAKQIAKEVAAFANTQGGTLLFGVKEESDRKPVKSPEGEDLGNDPKATVQSACVHNVFPPIVPEVSESLRNPNDSSRVFLVVRVGASEDIHTIDGGKGIYLRANDQSEPVRATIEQIEWLLQRRARAVSLQDERRQRNMQILRTALGTAGSAGHIEIGIGPKVVAEPLLDIIALREAVPNVSVQSRYFSWRPAPVDAREMKAVADAVYSVEGPLEIFGDGAGMLDVFGNITLITRLLDDYTGKQIWPQDLDVSRWTEKGEKLLGVNVAAAIERLICVVRVARNFYSSLGFVGLLELKFQAPNISGYPLIWVANHGVSISAICASGGEVCVRETLSTVELAENHTSALEPFVRRILWAWGSMHEELLRKVIEEAIRLHTGQL